MDGDALAARHPISRSDGAARLPFVTMRTPFDEAVRTHGPTVLRVCRATLGAGADADEAWSETFLSALRAWPGLPDSTNVEAWLVRVAKRRAIDVVRARSRRPVPVDPLEPGSSAVSEDSSAAGVGDHEVWDLVAALPERQRLALAYHYFGGLSHGETAELVGGSADAVRRAAADGMKTLRAAYRPPGATSPPGHHDPRPTRSPRRGGLPS